MKKEQTFMNMHLVPDALIVLDEHLTHPGGIFDNDHTAGFELTSADGGQWLFASFNDFFVEYEPLLDACYQRSRPDFDVRIINIAHARNPYCKVTVIAPDKQTIDDIFNIVEKYHEQSIFVLPNPDEETSSRPVAQSPMKKTKTFKHMQLVRQGFKELDQYLTCQGGIFGDPHSSLFEIVYPDGSRRAFEKSPAFLDDYFPLFFARYQRSRPGFDVNIVNFHDAHDLYTEVTVLAQDRRTIHDIFNIIEKYHIQSIIFSADPQREAKSLYACVKRDREKAASAQDLNAHAIASHPEVTKAASAQDLNAGESS